MKKEHFNPLLERYNSMRLFPRRSFVYVLLLILVFSAGCAPALINSTYRLYSGPQKTLQDVAVVKGEFPVILCKVDGQAGPNSRGRGLAFSPSSVNVYGVRKDNWRFIVELEPGKHTLEFDFEVVKHFNRTTQVIRAENPFPSIILDAKPGSEYVVEMYETEASINTKSSINVVINQTK
jgi:hypothetical protein